jgi:hypothetical protein
MGLFVLGETRSKEKCTPQTSKCGGQREIMLWRVAKRRSWVTGKKKKEQVGEERSKEGREGKACDMQAPVPFSTTL